MRPRRLLYIAFWYPPSRASGVYRALATTNAFGRAGWDITVLTTTEEFLHSEIGSVDRSLLGSIPPSTNMKRVPFTFAPNLREISRWRGNFPIAWQMWRDRVGSVRNQLMSQFGAVEPEIAESYATWIEPAAEAALGDGERFDHVLATGNPFASFEVARRISSSTSTPYSIDFRDPWTIDVFTGGNAQLSTGADAAEKLIVEQSSACIHVNQPIANAYRSKYPEHADKHHVVPNGFDGESVAVPPPVHRGGSLRFGILGTLNDRWPLEPIFRGWDLARPELPDGSMLILGGHLGYFAKSAEPLEKLLPPSSSGFEFLGPIAKADVASFYASLDVVIVPVPSSPMVTSGKIFEALGIGLPVVCVQADGGDARRLASGHPFAFLADPKSDSVYEAITAAASARRVQTERDIRSTREDMKAFERTNTMRAMVDVIETASSGQ